MDRSNTDVNSASNVCPQLCFQRRASISSSPQIGRIEAIEVHEVSQIEWFAAGMITRSHATRFQTNIRIEMPLRNLLSILIAAAVSFATYSVAVKNHGYEARVTKIMDLVQRESLLERTREELFDGMLDGMMKSLDQHSYYFANDEYKTFDDDLNQLYGGVGMYVDVNPENERLTVMTPIPGSPAFRAGVKPGDIIDKINGASTTEFDQNEAVDRMRGPIDTSVAVTFLRGDQSFTRTLTREMIPVPSLRGDRRDENANWIFTLEENPKIGYVQMIQFGDKTSDELRELLPRLDNTTDALIIDLRNNTGGYLDKALSICDMFLDGRYKILETRRRGDVLESQYFSKRGALYDNRKPIVILINRRSASASEILSACLQDHQRALVVGERSYGKGTVQNVIEIEDGRAAIKLTVANYWRPSGKNIDRDVAEARGDSSWGVEPNPGFEVELSLEQVFRNMQIRNRRGSISVPDSKLLEEIRQSEQKETLNQDAQDPDTGQRNTDQRDTDPAPGAQTDSQDTNDLKQEPLGNKDRESDDASRVPPATEDPVLKKAIEYLNKVLGKAAAA